MDLDENLPRNPQDPMTLLARQDLDPLSVDELDQRLADLEAEIERVKRHKVSAVNHRASADAIFKK